MKVIKRGRWALALVLALVASAGNAATSLTDGKYTFIAPGIANPSWPLFLDASETVKVAKKGSKSNPYWQLTGTGSTTSFWGGLSNSVNLGKDSVKYQANFNAAGQLITSIGHTKLSNYLEIKGGLPAGAFGGTSWKKQSNQLLLKATLLDANPGNGTPDLVGTDADSALGFDTKLTGGWAAKNLGFTGGSTGESLWLFGVSSGFKDLVKALDGDNGNGTLSSLFGKSKTIKGISSVAGVPVAGVSPGAAVVPLPGAVWLFGTGLMTLLASRRKGAGSRLAA